MTDLIHKPEHYNHTDVETIDTIQGDLTSEEFRGHLKAQVIRYLSRYRYKDIPILDLNKSKWYLDKLITEVEQDE